METRDLARIKAFKEAAHKPLVLDVLLAFALSWAATKAAVDGRPATGDIVVAVVAFLAVLLRRVRPLVALGIATASTIGAVWHGVSNPGLIVALGVITYSIAAHTSRREGWICALTASSLVYLTGLIISPQDWWRFESLGVFAWIFMAAALGDAVRSQRAYIREVEDRAQRAEQTREEEARRRVVDERVRIARELHDIVAHHIAVISVQAGAAAHVAERQPEQIGPALAQIRESSGTVLREIQSVVGVLRGDEPGGTGSESTEPTPGLARLPELLASFETAGFPVRLRRRGAERPLPAVTDLAAYRIAQEGLTNACKYGIGPIRLLVEYAPSGVIIEISNEIRPAPAEPGTGYGLLGMRERATSAAGFVSAGPTGDGRFRVHAVLPTEATAPAPHPPPPEPAVPPVIVPAAKSCPLSPLPKGRPA
ncbi:sensor histidine kinase [Actinoplanes sp. N902-109]|uniref:sensor histidine kinase n=1 Tax=Actinoplanes sp. (strain N902-109) TaxID=649831 RepID=UPI00032937AA|nr:histidine kinase [Actinoplanes sp. N902-109]AGL18524.1 histidine kinase [Actinoplanes sp. N902-109]